MDPCSRAHTWTRLKNFNSSYIIPNMEFYYTGRSAYGPTKEWVYVWGSGIAKEVQVGTKWDNEQLLDLISKPVISSMQTTMVLKNVKPFKPGQGVFTVQKVSNIGPTLAGRLAAQIIKELGQGYDTEEASLILEEAIMKVITGTGL